VLVYNDASLSLIKLKQEPAQGGSGAVDYLSIDFAQVAQAMGVPSKTITTIPQLRSDLRNEQQGPLLLDLHIDSQDYPEIMQAARG
jgi:thiamine pyrophosphate-dependent acetolactate synthase large subunit-like protein